MIVFERMFQPEDGTPPPLRIQIGAETAAVDRCLPTFNIPLSVLARLAGVRADRGCSIASVVRLATDVSLAARALGAIGSGSAAKLPGDFPSEVQPLVDDLNNLIEINGADGAASPNAGR